MESHSYFEWCLNADRHPYGRRFKGFYGAELSTSEFGALLYRSHRQGWTAENYWQWSVAARATNYQASKTLARIARMQRCFP